MKKYLWIILGMILLYSTPAMAEEVVYRSIPVHYDDIVDTVLPRAIRYVGQNTNGDYFFPDYWNGVSSKSQCWSCCVSMVLSYLGINKLPGSITAGGCVWGGYGADYTPVDALTGYENYLNGDGKVSPVVIQLPKYSAGGHYLILIGKVSKNTFLAVDPWNDDESPIVFRITISDNNVRYYRGQDTIRSAFQYIIPLNPN